MEGERPNYRRIRIRNTCLTVDIKRSPSEAKMPTNSFRTQLEDPDAFAVTWELVPGRGSWEDQQEALFTSAEQAKGDDRIAAISVTDNPGGEPAISPVEIAHELADDDIESLIHLTTRDENRLGLESTLSGLERAGLHNLLVMSGDYPAGGDAGQAKAVYDLDSVQLLDLIDRMNAGELDLENEFLPTNLFAGCVISPFKRLEAEVMTQYWKFEKKVAHGASFAIPQLGYDMRKFHELLQFVEEQELEISVLGNVYVPSSGLARMIHRGDLPGATMPDALLERINDDQSRRDRLERAAKRFAVFRGMGFDGVHLGGHGLTYEDVAFVIDRSEQFQSEWKNVLDDVHYPMDDGWYLYEEDEQSGLNTPTRRDLGPAGRPGLHYRTFELAHDELFDPDGRLFDLMYTITNRMDDTVLEGPLHAAERVGKSATLGCEDCGDCAIFDLGYLCPMSQCPKHERNGPCGGGMDGMCEVYPDTQECVYVRAYERYKAAGGTEKAREHLRDTYVAPPDRALDGSSSWLNYYAGRDTASQRAGIDPKES